MPIEQENVKQSDIYNHIISLENEINKYALLGKNSSVKSVVGENFVTFPRLKLYLKFFLSLFRGYRNDSNKRPGRLLNFSIFLGGAYSRGALKRVLIKLFENWCKLKKELYCFISFLFYLQKMDLNLIT